MSRRLFCLFSGLLLLFASGLNSTSSQGQPGLYVDAAQELGTINPFVYGSNHGPWAVVTMDLLPAARDSGITFLRFPGGNWGDQYDIAPWQLDFFMTLCNLMGAEPSIHVRLKDGTPEKAAELVRYANIEKGYNVRYWAIGNEPDLFDDYDTEQFNRDWRAIAEAMLVVDPSIIFLGPELSQYPPVFASTPKDSAGRDWLTEFLMVNGDMVDIVSIHRYPFPARRDRATTVDELLANPVEWDTIIPNLRALIRDITGNDLPVAVTEINSHWSGTAFNEASPDSFANALWLADVLGRLITQKVDIVAHFTLQSPSSFGGWGLLGQGDTIRPSYYVYQLFQRFGTTLLESASSVDNVSIYAARDDSTLSLIIVNLAEEAQTTTLTLDNFTPGGSAGVWRFDSQHQAEQIEDHLMEERREIILPGESVTLLLIPVQ